MKRETDFVYRDMAKKKKNIVPIFLIGQIGTIDETV